MFRRLFFGCAALLAATTLRAQEPTRVHVSGFADFSYLSTERQNGSGFREGALAGHFSAGLGDRATAFGEVTLFPTASGFTAEVQRVLLRYDFTDAVKISAGRFHTPLTRWNVMYHHGQWLQLTAQRPHMLSFGNTFLPQHYVGVMVEGRIAPAVLGLEYAAGLGNGRGQNILRAGDHADWNDHRAAIVSVSLTPAKLAGFRFGGAMYADRVPSAASPTIQVDERTYSSFLVRDLTRLTLHAEYIVQRHESRMEDSVAATSHAYFIQAGYRLGGHLASLSPYARYEKTALDERDPVFGATQRDRQIALLGMRYDFAPMAAAKAEYQWDRSATAGRTRNLWLQLSFTFGGNHANEPTAAEITGGSH